MDTIEFKLTKFKFGHNDDYSEVIEIYINGKNLIKMIKSDPNHPWYGTCLTENTLDSLYYDLVQSTNHEEEIEIYTCSCGFDCETFYVKVDTGSKVVVWYDWENGSCDCENIEYTTLRPYVFDRAQYESELKKLAYWHREYP